MFHGQEPFFKRGRRPQPLKNLASKVVKTPGINKKFVFFANIWKKDGVR
jgi:hypothetical protein